MDALTVDQARAMVRVGSRVLWAYRGDVEDGTVMIRNGDSLDLCWLDGHKSRNDTIEVGEVLAIFDRRSAKRVEVFPFSGNGHLTEAGRRWVEEHASKT